MSCTKQALPSTDVNPDFVIVGETRSFNWEMMHKAAYFVASGARFIATNPDTHGRGFYPACGRAVRRYRENLWP
ncbi:protein nagD [Enterobacter asburiae]|uniref:Protein nagD n=1 Tax=Enterobacter asburiae TaxID=61645 RepID=A0A376F2H4_ENTAS|nr:protein nagD [Enterobacter asburiae]